MVELCSTTHPTVTRVLIIKFKTISSPNSVYRGLLTRTIGGSQTHPERVLYALFGRKRGPGAPEPEKHTRVRPILDSIWTQSAQLKAQIKAFCCLYYDLHEISYTVSKAIIERSCLWVIQNSFIRKIDLFDHEKW